MKNLRERKSGTRALILIATFVLLSGQVCFSDKVPSTMKDAVTLDQKALEIIQHADRRQLLDELNDADINEICNFANDYTGVEWIKTRLYQTPFHDDIAQSFQNLARLYTFCHPPLAQEPLQNILKIKEHLHSKTSEQAAKAHDALGDYFRLYTMEFEKAIHHYQEARQIRIKLYGEEDPRITVNYGVLATTLFYHKSDKKTAEHLLMQSVDLRKKALGEKETVENTLLLRQALTDAADYYYLIDENDKTIILLSDALGLTVREKLSMDEVDILIRLGMVYLTLDKPSESLQYSKSAYEKAKLIYKEKKSPIFLRAITHLLEVVGTLNDQAAQKKLEAEQESIRQELLIDI